MRYWGCQYQNIDVDRIAASELDLVVLEPSLNDTEMRFISADQVEALKSKPDGSRRIVLGYLCVGEADTKRWFWPQAWRDRPPDWLGPENPQWPGSYPVRYWNPAWQQIVLGSSRSLLGHLVSTGYDGALLDRVDAFEDWEAVLPQAPERMADLVAAIAQEARAQRPDFLLVPQNAEPLLENQRYRETIDGLNKESLLTGLHGKNRFNQARRSRLEPRLHRSGQATGPEAVRDRIHERRRNQPARGASAARYGLHAVRRPPRPGSVSGAGQFRLGIYLYSHRSRRGEFGAHLDRVFLCPLLTSASAKTLLVMVANGQAWHRP